jgi:plastocyanin
MRDALQFIRRIRPCLLVMGAACALGAQAGLLNVRVIDEAGTPLQGAVVFVDTTGATPVPDLARPAAVMDQVDKKFVPQVLVVPVGADVSFPNSDHIRHHVYSFSEARSFELPLYAGAPAEPVRFSVPGVVVLGCNIHDWMRGYVVVVPEPFYAVTGADGTAVISGLPAGRWRVMGWHPDLALPRPVEGQEFDGAGQSASAELRMSLKRKLQLRRAPAGRGSDRY